MKKIILTLIFIILGLSLLASIDKLLIKKPYAAHNYSFYNEPKNSIDMLFFSSSTQHYAISPMYLWDKYGIVSYKKSIPHQSTPGLIAYVEEALHYQSPKVIYIDVQSMLVYPSEPDQYFIMTLSQIKSYYIKYKYIYKYFGLNSVVSDGNTIAKYHTRWKEIIRVDFKAEDYLKGFGDFWHSYMVTPTKEVMFDFNDKLEITDTMEAGLKYLLDLAEKNNTNLIFIAAPTFYSKSATMKRVATFEDLAKKYKLNYINLNNHLKEMKFDISKDMQDSNHPNFYGGKKIMDFVIPKIIEQYELQDHRCDSKYTNWHNDYAKYARTINREDIRRASNIFSIWYEKSQYDNYTILISSHGNILNNLPNDMKEKLKSLGLNKFETDKANQKYIAIIDDGKVFFEEISDNKAEYQGRMKNIVNLYVSSENNKAVINVSGKPRSKNKYGLNFVIYDKVNREIVDSIWIEPNKPDVVRR